MTKQEFETFLESKSREAGPVSSLDRDNRKREWLDALQKFYGKVDEWLQEYVASGRIEMEKQRINLHEDFLGSYQAEARLLAIGGALVYLMPVSAVPFGASGRVDLEGPKGTVKLLLTDEGSGGLAWKIATPPPRVQFIDLTSETFLQSLTDVVNG